jgi:glyoxylase-like metal-dependent hydrolase (beta-lactamase superfamily II)
LFLRQLLVHSFAESTMPGLKVSIIPVTPIQQNCTFITDADSGQTAIVDPGGDVPRIIAALQAGALTPTAIWLTHGHLDHAGGAAELAEKLKLDIIGPDKRDEMLLQSIVRQGQMYGIAGLRDCTPTRYLTEGDTVQVGPHVFDVLHCPGHTPGHVVFVNKAARFAQVGDVLFQGSVGRTDFPYGDHAALIDAIKTKLLPLGDDMAFVCGHGPNSTIGAERRSNPFIQ